ncbi:monocarboxylate transporter 13-like isoform X2 [Dermacentor variabilis]|uniref:monocarboxylate transporter 13-like isoform X2 n=1 Tax=Dermacentor variabilis TaxID=34621 RepID=UPI003F5C86B7
MWRTVSWKPKHTQGEGAAKQATPNGHANVSDGGGGPGVSSFAIDGGGTHKRRERDTKMPGPDSRLSWMVAVVCFLVNMMSSSYARCIGLFFSAIMSTFGVSRAEASLPLSVYNGFMFLSGLISGPLIQAFGTRKATTIGGILITVGLSVSFFAERVTTLAFSAGFLSGSGHGIILNSVLVCVSQYFDRRRGTALGLNLAGATIASLVFPKVYEYLLAEYGLHGALLIIGASMGNVVPLAIIMRAPRGRWPTMLKMSSLETSPTRA